VIPVQKKKKKSKPFPIQVRMGIAGVVRDKDTERGIADAVIAVDGINHDVTTGLCDREGLGRGAEGGAGPEPGSLSPELSLYSPQHGMGITGGY
jgi:hypothetical protein